MLPTPRTDSQTACYVCFEDNAPKSQCACNICIHDACLLKTLEYTNKPYCSICEEPYKNIVTQTIIKHQICTEYKLTIVLISVSTIGILCGTAALIACHMQYDEKYADIYRIIFLCAGILYLVAVFGLCMGFYISLDALRRNIPFRSECHHIISIRLISDV